jgi:hypothetical protein
MSLQADEIAAAWLWGAIGLHLGEERQVLAKLPAAVSVAGPLSVIAADGPPPSPLAELAYWLQLASSSLTTEQQRKPMRPRLALDLPQRAPHAAVLPAVMYIVGRTVPPSTDVDVWLDRIFDAEHRRQPVRTMRARAEAARWRGDGDAAHEWQTRAAVMTRLVEDYPTALLAHVAGLH